MATATQTPSIGSATVLRLRPFTVVRQGDDYLVGDPVKAIYVVLPDIGVRVLRMLAAGRTVGACTAELAGDGLDVDVVDFAGSLCAVGLAEVADDTELPGATAVLDDPDGHRGSRCGRARRGAVPATVGCARVGPTDLDAVGRLCRRRSGHADRVAGPVPERE